MPCRSGWDEQAVQLAVTHIISRAGYPASELRTSQWIKDNSAVCEITGYPVRKKVTKDKLYGISHKLSGVKDTAEQPEQASPISCLTCAMPFISSTSPILILKGSNGTAR